MPTGNALLMRRCGIDPVTPFAIDCPVQIAFGAGSAAALPDFVQHPVIFVQGSSGAASDPVLAMLGDVAQVIRCAGEPSVASINAALDALDGIAVQTVVACGGGSVLDTGKVLAVLAGSGMRLTEDFGQIDPALLERRANVRLIALPTTAGTGAEVTKNAVLDVPSLGTKLSIRGRALFPDHALVDPDLMAGAPRSVALHAGLDAVTQLIEAHTSVVATPFTRALTAQALPEALGALRTVVTGDVAGWPAMAWASLASGVALANGGLGAAHGLAAVLGARLGAPHGALCGRLLVPVMRANAGARGVEHCAAEVAAVFAPVENGDALSGLAAWIDAQGLPRLADFGATGDGLPELARLGSVASSSQKNAVPLSIETYEAILKAAL
ncbi:MULTISPECIES: iron-containing alcohol dehydrogenase [Roseobacteraceae]|nr:MULTISPECIES: iron-containing alcohol dehydrogenase [Roseobacteraceae]